jgi:hypothetical protein
LIGIEPAGTYTTPAKKSSKDIIGNSTKNPAEAGFIFD